MLTTVVPSPWVTGREASDYLNVSSRTLYRLRAEGILHVGTHWRKKFPARNSTILYHLERCEAAIGAACARDAQTLELAKGGL